MKRQVGAIVEQWQNLKVSSMCSMVAKRNDDADYSGTFSVFH